MPRAAPELADRGPARQTSDEAGIKTRIHTGPIYGTSGGRLDAECLVVHAPAITGEMQMGLKDGIFICHHLQEHPRVKGAQCRSVSVKTEGSGGNVCHCLSGSLSLRRIAAVADHPCEGMVAARQPVNTSGAQRRKNLSASAPV